MRELKIVKRRTTNCSRCGSLGNVVWIWGGIGGPATFTLGVLDAKLSNWGTFC